MTKNVKCWYVNYQEQNEKTPRGNLKNEDFGVLDWGIDN